MSLINTQKVLVSIPSVLAIAIGVSGILNADPIASGFIANEIHQTFHFLLREITARLSKHAKTKDCLDQSARRSFILAILATCEARRRMFGDKPWLPFALGDSEIDWLNRVSHHYKKELADMERGDYQVPHMVSETEAFELILTEEDHSSRVATLSAEISKSALKELKLGGLSPVPPRVEEMILHGWPTTPDDKLHFTSERLTLFKCMCAFFAEEMRGQDSPAASTWSQQILKHIHLTVADLDQRIDQRDLDFTARLAEQQKKIATLNSAIEQALSPEGLWQKINETGEQISLRLDRLSQQTEIITDRVGKILRIVAIRQRQFDEYQTAQSTKLDELRREIAEFKPYLLQISDDSERSAALRAIRQVSLLRRYAGGKVARLTDELIAEHKFLVGRKEFIAQLNEIVSKPPKLILITAKPGNGKTALLADWVKKQDKTFVAYHFFSSRYDRLRSWEDGLRNLLRQLYGYHGLHKVDTDLPSEIKELSDNLDFLLREVTDEPLTIVLDGLDEIEAPWGVVSPNFALPLPKNVCIIASARADKEENPAFLGEWLRKSKRLHLSELQEVEHFVAWLSQANNGELAECAAHEDFVEKLKDTTRGYPLYLRFLIQDLVDKAHEISSDEARSKCDILERELERKPVGFTDYVRDQWIELCQMDLLDLKKQNLFVLLTKTLGPIPESDVEKITRLKSGELLGLPPRVTRWLTKIDERFNNALFTFGHPTLAEEFSLAIGERQVNEEVRKLLRHCERWQENESRYALRYYAEHLRKKATAETGKQKESLQATLYSLARNEEFAKKIEDVFSDEPELSLHPIQNGLLYAEEVDDAGMMSEFVFRHHHRLSTLTKQSPLKVLQTGKLSRAIKVAELLLDVNGEQGALQFLALTWELTNQNRQDEAKQILCNLVKRKDRLVKFRREDWQKLAALVFSQTFAHSDECWVALLKLLLNDHGKLDLTLFALSNKLDTLEIEILERVLDIDDGDKRLRACLAIAEAKTNAGTSAASLLETLSTAKAAAEGISNEGLEAEAWALIAQTETTAGYDATESWRKAWETVEGISEDDQKEQASSRVKKLEAAPYKQVQEVSATPAIDLKAWAYTGFEAALATEVRDYSQTKSRVLELIEQHSASSGHDGLDESIAQTPAADHPGSSTPAVLTDDDLQELTDPISNELIAQVSSGREENALRIASGISDSDVKARAYYMIVKALGKLQHYDRALMTCSQIGDLFWKARGYSSIATMQSKENRLEEAAATAELIGDDNLKSQAYIRIALAYVRALCDDEAMKIASRMNDYWRELGCELIALAQVEVEHDRDALRTVELIRNDEWKSRVYSLIAQAQAAAGRENAALATAQAISLNRDVELPTVARAFVKAGNSSGFKKLLLPSSYYLKACYEMSSQLAELCPTRAADIANVIRQYG